MTARDLMTAHVMSCRAHEALSAAARLMWESDVGFVVVVDDKERLAGVITDRDICMATYTQGLAPSAIALAPIMSREVASCAPDASLHEVEQLMRARQIRRVVVVDAERRPIGVVAMNDLVRAVDGTRRGQGELIATLAAVGRARDALAARPSAA